jgi:CRP-like cAMP-binding protein
MDLSKLFKTCDDFKEFKAGTTIFSKGEPGNEMFIILDGEVDIHVGSGVIDNLKDTEVFGEMALIDSHVRSATAIARTDCRLAAIDEQRFLFLVRESPFFALDIMKIMACRLRRMNTKVSYQDQTRS